MSSVHNRKEGKVGLCTFVLGTFEIDPITRLGVRRWLYYFDPTLLPIFGGRLKG